MSADFKRSECVELNPRLTVHYGFTCIKGNQGPYFTITHSTLNSFGMATEEMLNMLPKLKPLLPFHLFTPEHGPMHYEANALYWLKQEAGEYEDHPYLRRKEHDPEPWSAFLSHVCWGSLPDDTHEKALHFDLTVISDEGRKLWLRNRLPKLQAKFLELISAADLNNELAQAQAWFKRT